jgi:hypothetical protein
VSGAEGPVVEHRDVGPLGLLHARPVILYAPDVELFDPAAALWSVLEALPVRPSYLVVGPTWTLEQGYPQDVLRPALEPLRNQFDHFHIVILASNAAESQALRDCDETPLWCSKGAFLDERSFFPIPERPRAFDAVYDAAWADYKRHHLAGDVASLALITYLNPRRSTINYYVRAFSAVAQATWLNPPWVLNERHLQPREVNEAYSTARVGLCLSKVEGIMRASIQYLLAGLPVVTTHNLGGRDAFFDPSYTRWVDDDPVEVARAVTELAHLDLDPQVIRRTVLAKVQEHRARFADWVRRTIEHEGGNPGRWGDVWPSDLPNQLAPLTPVGDIVRSVVNIDVS